MACHRSSCLGIVLILAFAQRAALQVVFAPAPAPLAGTSTISPESVNVLPTGFERDSVNTDFSSTHTQNSSALVPEAAATLGSQFQVFESYFQTVLGANPELQVLATSTPEGATTALVYLPETNQVTFSGWPSLTAPTTTNINKVDVDTGAVTPITLDAPLGSPVGANNGLGPYKGQIVVATGGNFFNANSPAGVALLDPQAGNWTWLANSYFGLRFNNINDLISLEDGTIIFSDSTDPSFDSLDKAGPPQLPGNVYALPPDGVVRVLVDGYDIISPTVGFLNGVEVSPDESVLYLGVSPNDPTNATLTAAANKIYAYDLAKPAGGGLFAQNKRTFAAVDSGYPDGFRVDTNGYLYTSAGDGVQVFSPGGELQGKIIVPPNAPAPYQTVVSLVFAGSNLVIGNNNQLLKVALNAQGPISTAIA